MTEVRKKCIKPFVRTAKRSVKFLSNPGKIGQCIAGTVFPSTKSVLARKIFLAGSLFDNWVNPPDFELAPDAHGQRIDLGMSPDNFRPE
jgi:hypothetical protein